jgi:hypothetical protein
MTALRAFLATYLVVTWALCLALFLTDGPEIVAMALVPASVLLVLNGVSVDGGDGVAMLMVAGLAVGQAAVLYAVAAWLRSLSPTARRAPASH